MTNSKVESQKIFKWKPFNYICKGFNGEEETIGGFTPSDVRGECSFVILKIHGPIIVGFKSWLMYQLVNSSN
jgi:hypothetical protein